MKWFFALLLLSTQAQAGELSGIWKNNRGVKKLEQGQAVQAFDAFTGALADIPYEGGIHYNIGNSFLANRDTERALSEYQLAMKLNPGDSQAEKDVRFRALFNSGIAATESKQTDAALQFYQQALDLNPESKETKTNIELLTANGGGGEGGDKDKEDKKDQGKGKDNKPQNPDKVENPRSTPKPFQGKEVSEQDVKRILEELKRQEEQIRARMQQGKAKDAPPGKDW